MDAYLFLNVFGSILRNTLKTALDLICSNSPNLTPETLQKDESGRSIPVAISYLNQVLFFLSFPFPLITFFPTVKFQNYSNHWSIYNTISVNQSELPSLCSSNLISSVSDQFFSCICFMIFVFLTTSKSSRAEGLARIWS